MIPSYPRPLLLLNAGRDTLITLMGLPPEDMYRSRDKGNSEAAQRQQVAAFLAQYEKYDWTKELM